MPVFPGDIIVGDGEGVVVIPAHMAEDVAKEAFEQGKFEDYVIEKVREGAGIFGLYPPDDAAKADYEKWKAKKG